MSYRDFVAGQERVYDKFRDTSKVRAEGIKPHKDVVDRVGGYIIAAIPDREVREELGIYSGMICKVAPSVLYGRENGHTTISVYDVRRGFEPDKDILDKLIGQIMRCVRNKPRIGTSYGSLLYNQDTVLFPGYPEEPFLELSGDIVRNLSEVGIDAKMPWEGHMTAAKFTGARKPEELGDFYELMRTLGERENVPSFMKEVFVGIFQTDSREFVLTAGEVLPLRRW